MKKQTKILSLILAVVMIMSVMPMTANATSTNEHNTAVPEGYIGVYTIEDLYCVRNDLTANYILMNDIDLSEATAEGGDWNYGGRGWNPIGSDNIYTGNAFSGIFDGNGYSIHGLNINIVNATLPSGATTLYLGVFAKVSGTVKNLTVKGKIELNQSATYSVKHYVGGIAGYCSGGTIENCINDVELDCTAPDHPVYAGGIVGYMSSGTINKCINIANLSLISSFRTTHAYTNKQDICEVFVGGVTAHNNGTILNCINTGDVNAFSNGGSSHWQSSGGMNSSIVYYYNYCDVYASGIATQGTVKECYNTGNISATRKEGEEYGRLYAGGITYSGNSTDCYNVGSSTGYSISKTSASNCYFLEGTGIESSGATQLTNGQMKLKSMYSGWDFDTIWTMDGREDYPYPELRNTALFFPGESTEHEHTYTSEITTPATHLTEGVMTYTCTCGDSYTEVIAKTTEHTYNAVITAPTCTDQGYTTFTCACGDTYVADYVNANEHSHTANVTTPATHITEGVMTYTCACGDSYTEAIKKTTEHTYKAVVIVPTCTSQGYTTYVCECGDSYESDLVDVTDHNDADNNYLCDNCGAELYKDSDDNHDAADNCSHICHKTGFLGFFAKIALFFWKLFGTNPVCECGMAHY